MKVLILALTFLMLLGSCGKNNESGKSGGSSFSPYTVVEETEIRRDFYTKANELYRMYAEPMKRMLGPRTVGLIRNKLKYENVQVTTRFLYDRNNRYTRSEHRDDLIILYVGREEQNLDWGRVRITNQYSRLVMHEMLIMGNVADTNFFYTDRILKLR